MVLWVAVPALSQPLDPAYHNLEEASAELLRLAEDNPEWIVVDTIGYGAFFHLPILMAKVSEHAARIESQAGVLFIGQVHAEEVIGVEITLELIGQLIERRDEEPFRERLEGLELYFIPTLNPDGFDVVHRGMDISYRKNCSDNIGDGRFRYLDRIGGDSSGVDLNRNFRLHWDRGDSLFQGAGNAEAYNYYRGAGPFSEPETRALRDVMAARRFLFSISYHSSRSGRNAELVIGPWNWEGKYPPDDGALQALGGALASRLPRQAGDGFYSSVRAMQRVGQEQDWAYQATGCFMYMVEVGAEIHPDSALMRRLVAENLAAAYYLMDLALGRAAVDDYGLLTVTVFDRATRSPVQAEVTVGPTLSPLLEPRLGDPGNGRYDQLCPGGNRPVTVRRAGYQSVVFDEVEIPDGGRASIAVPLDRLPGHSVTLSTIDDSSGVPISARISLLDDDSRVMRDFWVDGRRQLPLDEGFHRLLVRSEGYVPKLAAVEVTSDTTLSLRMSRGRVTYADDFEADRGWQRGGQGEAWDIELSGGRSCLTESPRAPYTPNNRAWLMLETALNLQPDRPAVVELIHSPYFEPGADNGTVQAFQPGSGQWIPLASFSCFPPETWDTSYVNLSRLGLEGGELRLRFIITADGSVEEDGWRLDRLALYYADSPAEVLLRIPAPSNISLAAYPSPSNGAVTVLLSLPTQQSGLLQLFDAAGRRVGMLGAGGFPAGLSRYVIDGSVLPSGAYFVLFRGAAGAAPSDPTTSFILLR